MGEYDPLVDRKWSGVDRGGVGESESSDVFG